MQGLDTRSYSSSVCKSPSNCKGNCQCGANQPHMKHKVINARTMRGKRTQPGATSKTTSIPIGKPSMDNYTRG